MRPAVILAIVLLLATPIVVRMVVGPPAAEHVEEPAHEAVPL
jgi:hypothetical protein